MLSNTDFATYLAQGETEIAQETPFIVERVSLAIVAGTSDYTLPDYAFEIRRATWLGQKLFNMDERVRKDIYQNVSLSNNSPVYYTANLIAAKTIRLHPTPSITLPSSGDPWLPAPIKANCIVEFYRTADASNTLPPYLRPIILRHYVGMRAYLREGVSQNLKASQYHRSRWMKQKEWFKAFLWDLYLTNKRSAITDISPPSRIPFKPILPIDRFGTSVDEY